MEVWKKVKGFEDKYQISSIGNLRSIDSVTINSRYGEMRIKGNETRVIKNDWGYLYSVLNFKGVEKSKCIHRLVAEAFIENPLNKEQVNHKDGIKTNNNIDNLEWSTRSENVKHAYDIGLNKGISGERHKGSKLTNIQAKEIRASFRVGIDIKSEFARRYKVDHSTIARVLNNQTYKNV